ncbi:MAG: DEAD/DEAH box helicase [Methanobacteriota archaeon]|nr:MAG: DEAD/DEAH box helicase [Euryarchaeota archaeon]
MLGDHFLTTFGELDLIEPLVNGTASLGHTSPTEIQRKAIPIILDGRDLLGVAQTGSGKTGAFVLPLLQKIRLEKRKHNPRVLIVAPTRELALQISNAVEEYGKFVKVRNVTIYGGVSQHPQVRILKKGTDIVVGTPGRLLDLANQGHLSFKTIETVVLDEADRMLDMGFIGDIRKILRMLPEKRQSLLFSATMTSNVVKLSHQFMEDPIEVIVHRTGRTVETIDNIVFFVEQQKKFGLLRHLLLQPNTEKVLIFTRTKYGAEKVAGLLNRNSIRSITIHGNKSQSAREMALDAFRTGKSRVLVATDVAARGIDVDNITHVINYDLPDTPETYVHRVGRTARAGRDGIAYSFCGPDEVRIFRGIERMIKKNLKRVDHPFRSIKREPPPTKLKSVPKKRKILH